MTNPPESTPVAGTPEPSAPPPRRRRRFSIPVLAATSVFSLVVALLVANWLVGDDDGPVPVEQFLSDEDATTSRVEGTATEGEPAPPTVLELMGDGAITLSDLTGTPVLLNFWASTCAPCLEEMPTLESAHQELGDQVTFIGVDVAESEEQGRKMLERTGVTYQQTRDPRGIVTTAYGGIGLPLTVIIDRDGVVSSVTNRAVDDAELAELLDPVL